MTSSVKMIFSLKQLLSPESSVGTEPAVPYLRIFPFAFPSSPVFTSLFMFRFIDPKL